MEVAEYHPKVRIKVMEVINDCKKAEEGEGKVTVPRGWTEVM